MTKPWGWQPGLLNPELFLRRRTVEGLSLSEIKRTSNIERPTLNGKDEDTGELIKIFVTSIKTAEKKHK